MPGSIITGPGQLRALLSTLGRKIQAKVLRGAARDVAKTMAGHVRAEAPVLSGRVKASVKVRAAKRRRNYIGSQVVISGGHPGAMIGFVHWGRKGQAANPFALRAFDAHKAEAEAEYLARVRAGIETITSQ